MQELYIDSTGQLDELIPRIRASSWLALDTEFIRERTYYPRLCLLQLANDKLVACIDPLALPNLEKLLDVIYDPDITKVFHAGRQDLEIFYHLREELPGPLFDTQIAAALLGYGDQVGYGALVKEMLDVELAKTHSRTNWSQRPLEPEQLHYAADDVRYLRDIYLRQLQTLESMGRLEWLAADFAVLADPGTYRNDANDAWKRIRGHQHLKGAQLATLQTIAAWREKLARQLDKPRKWLLRDELLLELARRQPRDHQALTKIRGLEAGIQRRYGDEIIALIRKAKELPAEQWPRTEKRSKLTPEQVIITNIMMELVRLIAKNNKISPSCLVTRKELEKIVNGKSDSPLMRGWRAELCGNLLRAFLDGQLQLKIEQGQLKYLFSQELPASQPGKA